MTQMSPKRPRGSAVVTLFAAVLVIAAFGPLRAVVPAVVPGLSGLRAKGGAAVRGHEAISEEREVAQRRSGTQTRWPRRGTDRVGLQVEGRSPGQGEAVGDRDGDGKAAAGSTGGKGRLMSPNEKEKVKGPTGNKPLKAANENKSNETAPDLPRCPHVILISAPRHGSTWLINSIEQCRYTMPAKDGVKRFSRLANLHSELWNKAQRGPVLPISATEAARYAKRNTSIKVFPAVMGRREAELRELLAEAVKLEVPVLVLTRRIEDAYGSWVEAKESGVWNKNSGGGGEGRVVEGREFDEYRWRVEWFFERALTVLREVGVRKVDVWEYEEVVGERFIVAGENGCYIRNCNFG